MQTEDKNFDNNLASDLRSSNQHCYRAIPNKTDHLVELAQAQINGRHGEVSWRSFRKLICRCRHVSRKRSRGTTIVPVALSFGLIGARESLDKRNRLAVTQHDSDASQTKLLWSIFSCFVTSGIGHVYSVNSSASSAREVRTAPPREDLQLPVGRLTGS